MSEFVEPRRLYIMQGVPGSGKTTIAQMLRSYHESVPAYEGFGMMCSVIVLSTDDYRYGDCGHYIFDPAKNATFHAHTQRDAADAMRRGVHYVIIDNTNILREHAYPYVALARMYNYEIDVIRVDPGLAEAKKRNGNRPIERSVPNEVIERMYATMENLL